MFELIVHVLMLDGIEREEAESPRDVRAPLASLLVVPLLQSLLFPLAALCLGREHNTPFVCGLRGKWGGAQGVSD